LNVKAVMSDVQVYAKQDKYPNGFLYEYDYFRSLDYVLFNHD